MLESRFRDWSQWVTCPEHSGGFGDAEGLRDEVLVKLPGFHQMHPPPSQEYISFRRGIWGLIELLRLNYDIWAPPINPVPVFNSEFHPWVETRVSIAVPARQCIANMEILFNKSPVEGSKTPFGVHTLCRKLRRRRQLLRRRRGRRSSRSRYPALCLNLMVITPLTIIHLTGKPFRRPLLLFMIPTSTTSWVPQVECARRTQQ